MSARACAICNTSARFASASRRRASARPRRRRSTIRIRVRPTDPATDWEVELFELTGRRGLPVFTRARVGRDTSPDDASGPSKADAAAGGEPLPGAFGLAFSTSVSVGHRPAGADRHTSDGHPQAAPLHHACDGHRESRPLPRTRAMAISQPAQGAISQLERQQLPAARRRRHPRRQRPWRRRRWCGRARARRGGRARGGGEGGGGGGHGSGFR